MLAGLALKQCIAITITVPIIIDLFDVDTPLDGIDKILMQPFSSKRSLLIPLKTSEKLWFSDALRGIKRKQ